MKAGVHSPGRTNVRPFDPNARDLHPVSRLPEAGAYERTDVRPLSRRFERGEVVWVFLDPQAADQRRAYACTGVHPYFRSGQPKPIRGDRKRVGTRGSPPVRGVRAYGCTPVRNEADCPTRKGEGTRTDVRLDVCTPVRLARMRALWPCNLLCCSHIACHLAIYFGGPGTRVGEKVVKNPDILKMGLAGILPALPQRALRPRNSASFGRSAPGNSPAFPGISEKAERLFDVTTPYASGTDPIGCPGLYKKVVMCTPVRTYKCPCWMTRRTTTIDPVRKEICGVVVRPRFPIQHLDGLSESYPTYCSPC